MTPETARQSRNLVLASLKLPAGSRHWPAGAFGVVYADPPWRFLTRSTKGRDRCPEARHYPTMGLADIKALPVEAASKPDAALFLWTTNDQLANALAVMAAWGFTYKTVAFVWGKLTKSGGPQMSTGYWTRSGAEICLMGTRGRPIRAARDVRQLILEPRREHSRKPDAARTGIERLMADHDRIELFARETTPGWTAWGNETERFG